MTKKELNAAVAKATYESIREIRRHGFNIVRPDDAKLKMEGVRRPNVIDWDELERHRRFSWV